VDRSRSDFKARVLSGGTVWSAGAYDALSAKLVAAAGFDAVFTSGLCISAALLGQPDAELYTMSENLDVVRRAGAAAGIPLVADADTGYGNAINVMSTVREFEAAGVAGLVLEDQLSPKRCPACAERLELLPLAEAAGKIRAAVAARTDPDLLVVARTDATDPAECVARARAYAAAGADLIQPISRSFRTFDELQRFRQACGMPLSLQVAGWIEQLERAQIASIAALAVFPLVGLMSAVHAMRENLQALREQGSARALPRPKEDHRRLNDFLGFARIEALQREYLPADAGAAP